MVDMKMVKKISQSKRVERQEDINERVALALKGVSDSLEILMADYSKRKFIKRWIWMIRQWRDKKKSKTV